MKKLFLSFLIFVFLLGTVEAIEVVRQKNVASYIFFPLVDADGDIVTGATGLDSEIDTFADGTAPDGFTDCTNEAIEIGSDGVYYLSLTQSEMNNDYIYIQVKSNAKTQHILIRTIIGDPLNLATSDDGGTINVTSGKIDEVSALTGHTAQTGDSYAIVNNGTYGNSAIEGLVDDLESRLTSARAGYLDKLNVSGTLAHSDDASIYKATGFSTHSAADVWAVGTRALTDKTGFGISSAAAGDYSEIGTDVWATGTRTLTDKAGFSLSASGIDAIWDEVITGHSTADSFGKVFDDQIDGLRTYGDTNWPTATGFSTHSAADVWNHDISGYSGSGYAGTYLKGLWDKKPAGNMLSDTVWTGTKAGYLDEAISGIDDNPWNDASRTLTAFGFDVSLSAAAIDAIWDEVITGHSTADSFGKVFDDQIDGLRTYGDTNWLTATGFSTHSAADIWSVGTRALTDKAGFGLAADQSGVTIGTVNDLGTEAENDVWKQSR